MFEGIREALMMNRLYFVYRRSRASIEKWQVDRMRKLIAHARRNVPFYRDRFARSKVTEACIRTLADLPLVPPLNKKLLLERPFEEYIDNSKPVALQWKKSSGTTGFPISIVVSGLRTLRAFNDFMSYRFVLKEFEHPKNLKNRRITLLDVHGKDAVNRQFIHLIDFRTAPEKSIQQIAAFDPDILTSFPSTLLEIAEHIKTIGTIALRPRFVVAFGEILQPSVRRLLEESFACKVFDRYGSTEGGGMAAECSRHDGMHVNSESTILEVVDDQGVPVPDGERGRIIVTDLMNYTMPLIRYQIGDYGVLSRERCACGLETPRIWVDGRSHAYLTVANQTFHHIEFDLAFEGFMHVILQYQLVKKSDDALCVRVIPGPAFADDSIGRIEKTIRSIVGSGVEITIEVVEKIERTPRGKTKLIIDESILEN